MIRKDRPGEAEFGSEPGGRHGREVGRDGDPGRRGGDIVLKALMAQYYLGEDVNITRWVGTSVIVIGVAIVGLSKMIGK